MKIRRIAATWVRVPLHQPYEVRRNHYMDSGHMILKITSDDGTTGCSEVPSFQGVASMRAALLDQLAPRLIGMDPRQPRAINDVMMKATTGSPTVRCALDVAAYDLFGKAVGMSVSALLGGRFRDSVPVADVIGLVSPEVAQAESVRLVHEGYTAVKLKGGRDFVRDLATVRAVREAVGTEVVIRLDINEGYLNAALALPRCRALEAAGVDIFEQPVPGRDLPGMALLADKLVSPVLAHESLSDLSDAVRIIELRAADILNVSPPKAGGLYNCMQIVSFAELHNVPVMLAGAMECGPGTVAAAHLAAACREQLFAGDSRTVLRNTHSLVNEPIEISGGWCAVPDAPGLGVTLDEDAVEEFRVEPWVEVTD